MNQLRKEVDIVHQWIRNELTKHYNTETRKQKYRKYANQLLAEIDAIRRILVEDTHGQDRAVRNSLYNANCLT